MENTNQNPFLKLPRDMRHHIYRFLDLPSMNAMARVDKGLNLFSKSENLLESIAKKERDDASSMLRFQMLAVFHEWFKILTIDEETAQKTLTALAEVNQQMETLSRNPSKKAAEEHYQTLRAAFDLKDTMFDGALDIIEIMFDDLFIKKHQLPENRVRPIKITYTWDKLIASYSEVACNVELYTALTKLFLGLPMLPPEIAEFHKQIADNLMSALKKENSSLRVVEGAFFTFIFLILLRTKSFFLLKDYIDSNDLENIKFSCFNQESNLKEYIWLSLMNLALRKDFKEFLPIISYMLTEKPALFRAELKTVSMMGGEQQTLQHPLLALFVSIITKTEDQLEMHTMQNLETFAWLLIHNGHSLTEELKPGISPIIKLQEWLAKNSDPALLADKSDAYVQHHNKKIEIADKFIAYQHKLENTAVNKLAP